MALTVTDDRFYVFEKVITVDERPEHGERKDLGDYLAVGCSYLLSATATRTRYPNTVTTNSAFCHVLQPAISTTTLQNVPESPASVRPGYLEPS